LPLHETTAHALIFDWGGVLMRTIDYTPRHVWDAALGMQRGAVESVVHGCPEWIEAQCGRLSTEEYWQAVAWRLGLSVQQREALREAFYSGDRLDTRLVDLVQQQRRQGVRVALLSNNIRELRDDLTEIGLNSLFEPCVISAEIGVMKPERKAYEAVLALVGLPAGRCLFIDDSQANVTGAQTAGLEAVLYTPELDLQAVISQWTAHL